MLKIARHNAQLVHPDYRSDVDGLRGLAVLLVVAYHAFPFWFKGGFIGVDVFFVISGFLISTIVFQSLQEDRFSFIAFYSRRIRRIFPALIVVLLTCLISGWFFLLADEYSQLGKQVAGGAIFISNFLLWKESGYFDIAAESKPLLHLWSLGIEEQFYLAWPALAWLAWKFKTGWLTITVIAIGISFATNLHEPDAITAFYMPQTRFWELLAGGLLAYSCMDAQSAQLSKLHTHWIQTATFPQAALCETVSIVGLCLLGLGLIFIDNQTRYPYAWALFPTMGTALIIAGGSETFINRRFFSNSAIIWFGLISYPMYLWHWSILSFARIIENQALSAPVAVAAIIGATALAWLTYKFIERPIRSGTATLWKAVALAVILLAVGTAGLVIHRLGGVPSRPAFTDTAKLSTYDYLNGSTIEEFWKKSCFSVHTEVSFFRKNGCEITKYPGAKKVFLIGDSHAAYLSKGLQKYLDSRRINLFMFSAAWCTPFFLEDKRKRCSNINAYVEKMIERERPDFLVLFANYFAYRNVQTFEKLPFEKFVAQRAGDYKKLGLKKVIIVGQNPIWDEDGLPKILLRRFVLKRKSIPDRTFDGLLKESLEWDKRLREQEYPSGVAYLSLKDLLCNNTGCLTKVGPNIKTDLIVHDSGHLTPAGAGFITRRLLSAAIQ